MSRVILVPLASAAVATLLASGSPSAIERGAVRGGASSGCPADSSPSRGSQSRGSPARAPAQAAIDAAIERGVAHLCTLYADGEGRGLPTERPRLQLVDYPGLRALTVYALLESGLEPAHPVVRRLVAGLARDDVCSTYDAACVLLALEAFDPFGQRDWIGELASDLLSWQEHEGDWGYPGGGDLSNTQYAALGLRAAAAAGVEVPAQAWTELARAVLDYRTRDGGFAYVARGRSATGSMTAAGVATLAICEIELSRLGASALDAELAVELAAARADGLAWLGREFRPDANPEHTAWTHYWLWGVERVGALAGAERLGAHDWYAEGACFLVETQGGDGVWSGTFERVPTLYALLFLERATRARAPSTPASGAARERPPPDAGPVRLLVEGERPLHMSLGPFSPAVLAELEWPEERGVGPRIARVEYLADGVPIAALLGDPTHPAGRSDFACETRLLAPGPHRLTARVHVRGPEHAATESAALLSNTVDVEVRAELPVLPAPAPAPRDPALVESAKARAEASSVHSDPAHPRGFGARHAVDGNPRSPWLAAPADERPTLAIELRKRARADTIRIEPARLVPDTPEFLTRPLGIEVRLGRGPWRAATLAADGRAVLELEEPQRLRRIELRLVGRAGPGADRAGAVVGLGEVRISLEREQEGRRK